MINESESEDLEIEIEECPKIDLMVKNPSYEMHCNLSLRLLLRDSKHSREGSKVRATDEFV